MFEQAKNGSGFVDYSSFKKITVEFLGWETDDSEVSGLVKPGWWWNKEEGEGDEDGTSCGEDCFWSGHPVEIIAMSVGRRNSWMVQYICSIRMIFSYGQCLYVSTPSKAYFVLNLISESNS